MHRHSEGAAPKAGGAEMSSALMMPPEVSEQLRRVDRAYRGVAAALKTEELTSVKEAYGWLSEAIGQVESDLLSGHPRMLWQELAMLLGNDAFEGREAETLEVAKTVFLLLKQHVQRLQDGFGLTAHPIPEKTPPVPEGSGPKHEGSGHIHE